MSQGAPKILTNLEKSSWNRKSKNQQIISGKNRNLDFETSSVKFGSKLTELLASEDTVPLFAEIRQFDFYLVNVSSQYSQREKH